MGSAATHLLERQRLSPHLAGRIFDTPLLVTREKADVILSVLADRLGIEAPLAQFDDDERDRKPYERDGSVAVVSVAGTLVHKASGMDAMSGMTSYAQIGQDLDKALADPAVAGILLDIDSPGGECAGCFELAEKISAARSQKPIFAAVHPMACSGAYALAAAASKVYAPEIGYVGSIGVYTCHADRSEANKRYGVTYTMVYAGERKVDGDQNAPLSADAKAAMQSRVDQIYDVFVESVAKNRGMTAGAVRATQAAVLLGEAAKSAGLVDEIGDRAAALSALKAQIEETTMLQQLQQQVSVLTKEKAELASERDSLREKIAAFEAAQAKAKAEAEAAWVESLRASSAQGQGPLLADEITAVEAELKAGNRAGAERLAAAYLKVAKTRSAPTAGDGARSEKLVDGPPPGKSAAEAEAAILERRGWTVTLNSDKTQILDAIAPGKAPKTKKGR